MKIIIVTEGSSKIGFGHITRCMSLYQAFREKELPVQFVVNGDSTIEHLLENTEHSIFNWLEESRRFFKLLDTSDILIIDSYLADKSFYEKISESVALAVYIDDNKRIDYPRGTVINGSILAEKMDYPQVNEVKYLLGSQYIPLRREFWNVPEKETKKSLKNIMVTFGGDDLRNLTPDILKILVNGYPHINKKIVIGRGFEKISEIENLKDDTTELIYYPGARGMLQTMLDSDLAISAGGQTLYELARTGVPTIAIGVAHNQINNVKNWQEVGFVEFAGFWDNENLQEHIKGKLKLLEGPDLRINKSKIGKMSVNGKGAVKIVKHCLNEYYAKNIQLREAELKDIYNVYNLSNEEEVRQNSFNSDKIKFENHEKWFKDKIKDPNNIFLIVESWNNFAGQVRFELEGNEATISISIDKKFRELGLGRNIIENSIEYLKLNVSQIKIVKAYIKEDNKKSLRLFEKMNFKNKENFLMKNQNALQYIYKIKG